MAMTQAYPLSIARFYGVGGNQLGGDHIARSSLSGSFAMCAGLFTTYLLLPEGGPVAIFRTAAIGAALAIGLGIFFEARGVRSLVRADVLMLVALFGLTLVEYFFPQSEPEGVLTSQNSTRGVELLFLAFAGLIIGRHLAPRPRPSPSIMRSAQWTPATLFRVYIALFFLGFLNLLVAVNFDPVELVSQMLRPRFTQPWTRGAWGSWSDLLGEFSGLILYLVPALAGAILAVPTRYTLLQKTFVSFGLLFTLFYGFSSGTRNVFCIYLITFIGAYILRRPRITWGRTALLSCLAAGLLFFAAYHMLQFRKVGLEGYLSENDDQGWRSETLFIDQNLPVISQLTDLFPDTYQYLGSEFASFAILHPIPRAIWPSKPMRLSIRVEDALGVGMHTTVSSTFVGEAYMMGGYSAVLIVGLLFGVLAGWWNRLLVDLRSTIHIIIYASGFFAALISMRSVLWTTTAMLPVVGLWFWAKWYSGKSQRPRTLAAARIVRHVVNSKR
jgi:oligosaccharide repeat unit polymerase